MALPSLKDVSEQDKEAVEYLVKHGIIKGMDNGKFEGQLPITRAMVLETLMRISKDKSISYDNKFADVKADEWYYNSVRWAAQRGIVKGYKDGTFKPNQVLSRAEFAAVIDRFVKEKNVNLNNVQEFKYEDKTDLPDWAKENIISAAKKGVVNGKTSTKYEATSDYTRSELAHSLYRILKWVENN